MEVKVVSEGDDDDDTDDDDGGEGVELNVSKIVYLTSTYVQRKKITSVEAMWSM